MHLYLYSQVYNKVNDDKYFYNLIKLILFNGINLKWEIKLRNIKYIFYIYIYI